MFHLFVLSQGMRAYALSSLVGAICGLHCLPGSAKALWYTAICSIANVVNIEPWCENMCVQEVDTTPSHSSRSKKKIFSNQLVNYSSSLLDSDRCIRVVRNIPQRIFNILTQVITPVACLVSDWCLTRNLAGMECTGLPICRILFGKTLVCALFGTRQNRTQHVATLLRDRWLARILKLTCGGCQTTARPSQVKSSQVKSSQVKSSQVKSSQVKSSRVESSRVESSRVKSSRRVRALQGESNQVNSNQVKSSPRANGNPLRENKLPPSATANCTNSSIERSHKTRLRTATFCQWSHRFHLANSSIFVSNAFSLLPTVFARGCHLNARFAQRLGGRFSM